MPPKVGEAADFNLAAKQMSGLDENALKIVKIGQEVGGWFGRGQILDASSIENQTSQHLRMLNSGSQLSEISKFYKNQKRPKEPPQIGCHRYICNKAEKNTVSVQYISVITPFDIERLKKDWSTCCKKSVFVRLQSLQHDFSILTCPVQ